MKQPNRGTGTKSRKLARKWLSKPPGTENPEGEWLRGAEGWKDLMPFDAAIGTTDHHRSRRGRPLIAALLGPIVLVFLLAPFITLAFATHWQTFHFAPGDWGAVRVSLGYGLLSLPIIVCLGTPLRAAAPNPQINNALTQNRVRQEFSKSPWKGREQSKHIENL